MDLRVANGTMFVAFDMVHNACFADWKSIEIESRHYSILIPIVYIVKGARSCVGMFVVLFFLWIFLVYVEQRDTQKVSAYI